MKQKSHFCFIFFLMFLLLTSQLFTAYTSSFNHGEEGGKAEELDVVGDEVPFQKLEINTESVLNDLMGLESCENGEKECFDRRILAEAHLDYIYTQHHKP